MQLFVCLVHYTKPFEEVSLYLNEHRSYLKKGYEAGFLLASGPRIPKTGGIIIGKFVDENAAKSFAKNDPFTQHNVAQYEIMPFEPVLYAEILKDFLES
ncbi:YciI family protein [Helicobacter marmotae]|uniref:GTP cyclohydrolase n=1 Tax=Helicobacter marmotae TaxID=152490 RepID=A0A3D8I6D8_9HELI|nr:YciI family protein [Helicobacter marmotae]RDU60121.1 GTP cyclohydrolase [Helicobacter marmotae]